MTERVGYRCRRCGQWHAELPFAYHAEAPARWGTHDPSDERSVLSEDQCVIGGEHFFVRGLIRLSVVDSDQDFEWGVWVSLSRENFTRTGELWDTPGREREPPYFGWLSTDLRIYSPATLNLKTNVHTRPLKLRPLVELEETDHPVAVEQRDGITAVQPDPPSGAAQEHVAYVIERPGYAHRREWEHEPTPPANVRIQVSRPNPHNTCMPRSRSATSRVGIRTRAVSRDLVAA